MMGSKVWRLGVGLVFLFCGVGTAFAAGQTAAVEKCKKYEPKAQDSATSTSKEGNLGFGNVGAGGAASREKREHYQAKSQEELTLQSRMHTVCLHHVDGIYNSKEYATLQSAALEGLEGFNRAIKLVNERKAKRVEEEEEEKAGVDRAKKDEQARFANEREQQLLADKARTEQAERHERERERKHQEDLAAAKRDKSLAKAKSSGSGMSWKLLGGGVVALGGGALVGTTTLTAYTEGKGPNGPEDEWKQLQLLNSVGWGLVIVGGATAGTAFLSPDGIVIGGQF
jgi:hypothetical protein